MRDLAKFAGYVRVFSFVCIVIVVCLDELVDFPVGLANNAKLFLGDGSLAHRLIFEILTFLLFISFKDWILG